MKQTIFNFNQQAILDLTKINDDGKIIRLDATDLLILDWFIYFTPNMTFINVNGKIYYWLSYSKLQEDLPFLDFKKRTFTDKLKKLCDLEILSFHYEKNQGSITYYGFGNNYLKLIEDTNRCATNVGGCSQDNNGVAVKTTTGLHLTQQQDSSINNNPINNNSNINNININNTNNKKKKEKVEIENLEERLKVIYDYWNTKGIIEHKKGLTKEIKEAYTKAIIKWELNDEIIKEAIDHYDTMLKDNNCKLSYPWTLAEFLSQENGARTFTSESSRWNNYQNSKNKPYVVKQNNGLVNYEIDPTAPYRNRGDNDF